MDLNGKWKKLFTERFSASPSDNASAAKRSKVDDLIEKQSSASILEEIARGKFKAEQDMKNAEKKMGDLEATKKQLEDEKNGLLKSLEVSEAANVKKDAQIVELTEAVTCFRKFIIKRWLPEKRTPIFSKYWKIVWNPNPWTVRTILIRFYRTPVWWFLIYTKILEQIFPSQLKISLGPKALNRFLEGLYKFFGLDSNGMPVYKHVRKRLWWPSSTPFKGILISKKLVLIDTSALFTCSSEKKLAFLFFSMVHTVWLIIYDNHSQIESWHILPTFSWMGCWRKHPSQLLWIQCQGLKIILFECSSIITVICIPYAENSMYHTP